MASCTVCGCSAFATVFVLTGGGVGQRIRATPAEDPLDALLARVRRLPVLERMEKQASTTRGRSECLKQMPTMLDVVTLGLSAGLSFDSSLELYCGRYDSELARVLGAAMLTWRLGTESREEALMGVACKLRMASFDRFVGVVTQALAFGSPLAVTLEHQAQAIRDEQRSQIEEEIEQVPVKMLIPLGVLIVPAMLLAILGPLFGASLSLG